MSDAACQTPGCGHAKGLHSAEHNGRWCSGGDPAARFGLCQCTGYTAPTETEPNAARDELVDVMKEALDSHEDSDGGEWCACESPPARMTSEHLAAAAYAALVSRYGEPEIELQWGRMKGPIRPRRLVFPWQEVTE